jgi:hypothetical protein
LRTTIRAAIATTTATIATAGLLAAASPAAQAAQPPITEGEVLGVVVAHGDSAEITGRFRCFGGMQAHLWSSIKQGDRITPEHSNSYYADSWYDTNYNFTPETPQGLTVPCDGRFHAQRFTLKRVFETPWGTTFNGVPLTSGKAWVQFCLVPGPDESSASSFSQFLEVKAG